MKIWAWTIIFAGVHLAVIGSAVAIIEQNEADSMASTLEKYLRPGDYDEHIWMANAAWLIAISGVMLAIGGVTAGAIAGMKDPSRPVVAVEYSLGSESVKRWTIRQAFMKKVLLAILSIMVATSVVLTVLWFPQPDEEYFSLSQVQGGIKCTMLKDYGCWAYSMVIIDNGTAGVHWWLGYASNLSCGAWTAEQFDDPLPGNISEFQFRLVVVDLLGDGNISRSDYLVVTATNSAVFKSDVLYNFTLMHGSPAISGRSIEQSFKFVDGRLVTGKQKIHIWFD